MRFPKRIKHRDEVAVIYGKTKACPYYRVAWKAAGRRQMKTLAKYGEAKAHAEATVRELAKGSVVTALTPGQARDALAAFERLQSHFQTTGRRVSLLAAVSCFAESDVKLAGRATMGDAIAGFLSGIASVKRKDIKEAVAEFTALRKPLTEAKAGKRAQLSANYNYMTGLWLGWFADSFPNTAVCDVTKEHLNLWMNKFSGQSAVSRNHYRGTLKMFLRWCAKRDYLPANHRLFEADSLTTEASDGQETDFYRPQELQALLDGAGAQPEVKDILPVLALGGLAGLRLEEAMRLEWSDVWRVTGHVEISSLKAKTRSRRLVEICPALATWLAPYRESIGIIFAMHRDSFHAKFAALRESLKIPARRNGMRHAFCSYHFALHANENLTAQQAGNSPAMIHGHYKGLATKAEAEKWFDVRPMKVANVIQQPMEKVS